MIKKIAYTYLCINILYASSPSGTFNFNQTFTTGLTNSGVFGIGFDANNNALINDGGSTLRTYTYNDSGNFLNTTTFSYTLSTASFGLAMNNEYVFLVNNSPAALTIDQYDTNSHTFTNISNPGLGTADTLSGIAFDSNQTHAFILQNNTGSSSFTVHIFDVTGSYTLTPHTTVTLNYENSALGIVLSPDDAFAYISFVVSGHILAYPYDSSNFTFGTTPNLVVTATNSHSIGLSPDYKHFFVGDNAANNIYIYDYYYPILILSSYSLTWDQNVSIPIITATAQNLTGSYTYSSSNLPTGLSIDTSSGVISGTPTVTGSGTANIIVSNNGASTSKNLSYVINPALTFSLSTSSLNWDINTPIHTITASTSLGTPPYSYTAFGLPAGLSFDTTSGSISGTPTATGTGTVIVTVSDTCGASISQSFSYAISPAFMFPFSNLTQILGSSFSTTLSITGGKPPYTYAYSSPLPSWMSFNTLSNTITGTGTSITSGAVVISATDANHITVASTLSYRITTNIIMQDFPSSLVIPKSRPIDSFQVTANGGTAPYSFSATNFPQGLTISPQGIISGMPYYIGDGILTIHVQDNAGHSFSQNLTYSVTPQNINDQKTHYIMENIPLTQSYSSVFSNTMLKLLKTKPVTYNDYIVFGDCGLGTTHTAFPVIDSSDGLGALTFLNSHFSVVTTDEPAELVSNNLPVKKGSSNLFCTPNGKTIPYNTTNISSTFPFSKYYQNWSSVEPLPGFSPTTTSQFSGATVPIKLMSLKKYYIHSVTGGMYTSGSTIHFNFIIASDLYLTHIKERGILSVKYL